MDKQATIELVEKYLEGKASAEEKQQFFYLLEHDQEFEEHFKALVEAQYKEGVFDAEPDEKLRLLIQARLQKAIGEGRTKPAKVVFFRRIAVAAAVVILLVTGYVLWVTRGEKQVTGNRSQVATTHDVPAPSNTRAVITLADGSKVYLDSAGNGTIAKENNVAVIKNSEGGIEYLSPAGGGGLNASPNRERPGVDVSYNTLSNPRGSKVISLTLSDGTKVWLNSESSLKYPIAFASTTREVEITGEAYFEVKHNAKQPFKVHLPNGSVVEDIGTSFNINAYTDQDAIKTTLIEGKVRLSPAGGGGARREGVDLNPGEQAVINQANPKIARIEVQTADVDEVLAWKNGMFQFDRASLQEVMQQIGRWYNVDVSYQGKIEPMQFGGKISRSSNLSEVLKILQLSKVNYKIEGNKVVVMP